MKGVVFTEFLEMVKERFSPDVVDEIIEACDLPSGGSYTATGTYHHDELIQLVSRLSSTTGLPVPDLVREFGRHLFGRFVAMYPRLFVGVSSAFTFLMNIETHIHAEVKKLYPDAELPRFQCTVLSADHLEMIYRSSRPFADLAEGLMVGCVEHFGEEVDIRRQALPDEREQAVRFSLIRRAGALRCTT